MATGFSRRHVLQGGAALAAAGVIGFPAHQVVHAARNRVVVRVERELQNLDPANRTGPTEVNVILAVAEGLVRFKPGTTEWEPALAASIAQVDDTHIDFTLHEGLSFTGGHGEVTAEDVKFSFERFIKPGPDGKTVAYADDWAALDHVEVTGKLSGRIVLKQPAPALWVIALADGSGAILSRKATEAAGGDIAAKLLGAGPYILKESGREQFVLVANPDYKGPRPAFAEIVGKPIAETKTAEIAFQAGEIDFTRIDPVSAAKLEAQPETAVERLTGIDYVWLGPNIEKKPFDDLRVRQALRKAIDVDAILAAAYNGLAPRANALEAPSLLGHWAEAPVYARDVEGARALLAEAGLADGFRTSLTVLAGAEAQATALVVQANLAEIGVEVEIRPLDGGAYWALGENDASKDLELSLVDYNGKADPGFQTQWFTSDQVGKWNWQRWKNADFDALHKEAGATVDPAKRAELYVRAQKLMDDSAAFVWITHKAYAFGRRSWLTPGILPNGNTWLFPAFKEA